METHSSILACRNPMDRRAWWAIVHGVAKSQTRLKQPGIPFTEHLPSPVLDSEVRDENETLSMPLRRFQTGAGRETWKVILTIQSSKDSEMNFQSAMRRHRYICLCCVHQGRLPGRGDHLSPNNCWKLVRWRTNSKEQEHGWGIRRYKEFTTTFIVRHGWSYGNECGLYQGKAHSVFCSALLL